MRSFWRLRGIFHTGCGVISFLALAGAVLLSGGCAGLGSGSNTRPGGTVPAPSITSLNPASGFVGTSVTITGANFGASQGSSTVRFNGISATPTSWSATSIVAPVPAGATTGNVVVTVGGVASNGVSFTVQSDTTPPVVTVTAPANNSAASGTITLTATATDPDSPVSFVQFLVDGANFGPQLTSAPYSTSLDTTTLTNGSHTVAAAAQDPSGNRGTSTGVTITVSNSTGSVIPALVGNGACPNSGTSGTPNWPTTPPFEYRCNTVEPTTAGNTLIVAFGTSGTGPYTVTDEQGDTFTLDATSPASNGRTLLMFRATNIAAGSTWISVHSNGRDNYWQPMVFEVDNAAALDASSCSTGSSASITAGSLTPTVGGDVILQVSYSPAYNSPPGTNTSFAAGSQPSITWALAHALLGDGSASQWGIYNSTATINPTFTSGTSSGFISCAVALQQTPTGGAQTVFHVVHQEHDSMPKNAPNPWNVGIPVDVSGAVYLAYVGNDSITSVTSSPSPNVGWTASGADFNGLNGHNHVNIYCASWTTPPGYVTLSINRSSTSNDSINMVYVVAKGTCNLDVDSGGQAANQASIVSQMTVCNGCLTPTAQDDLILSAGGQFDCTATSLVAPATNAHFATGWYNGNTVGGPQQVDENNMWSVIRNGTSLNPITVTVGETCGGTVEGNWANRLAAYKTLP